MNTKGDNNTDVLPSLLLYEGRKDITNQGEKMTKKKEVQEVRKLIDDTLAQIRLHIPGFANGISGTTIGGKAEVGALIDETTRQIAKLRRIG